MHIKSGYFTNKYKLNLDTSNAADHQYLNKGCNHEAYIVVCNISNIWVFVDIFNSKTGS